MNAAIKQPNIVNDSFLEWCESELARVLEEDMIQTVESCWEHEEAATLKVCLAFRGAPWRPSILDTFNRMCAVSDDVIPALKDGEVETLQVLEIALFPSDSLFNQMPPELREVCSWFRRHILEAAQQWRWVQNTFASERATAMERMRCACGGRCVCE